MSDSKKKIVIVGAGGLGKGIAQLIKDINRVEHVWDLLGFFDDDPELQGKKVSGLPVLGRLEGLGDTDYRNVYAISAIGTSVGRDRIINKVLGINPSISFPILVHPTAIIGDDTEIGEGTTVGAYSIIEPNNRIGANVLIHYGCTIGHDCVIEDFSTVLPGTNISGHVKLFFGSYLGSNSTVLPGTAIGPFTIVGAGAVVVRSLPGRCTAVGVPAKLIKKNDEV
ncbi:acetyltransferase [Paenibacillus flagellatus]|uniref:Sugar O-acyltransferase n=1 Tax=Paenibacillus flagellatus TaxID=2211139 RepID=A0A2V5KC76_9BACL|nr:acetyltransferase [Paenibacillus flagellatus]PYI57191.1 sugar O-acyltransferase [Paenibacillus flagellatus]